VKPTSSFSDSTCEHQVHMAERELAAFLRAVTEMFGPEQARFSAEDSLDEWELRGSPHQSTNRGPTNRDWRAVTVAATVRLASRLGLPPHYRTQLAGSIDTKVSPIPTSNCFASTLLV
jgi:hypothetical protein